MVQPAVRIGSARDAHDAARGLETPSEVQQFEAMASESAALRTYLQTPQWADIRNRIVGDGRPPLGRPRDLGDVSRFFRWSADGAFSEESLRAEVRAAYLHAAAEIDAFHRRADRSAPVSPAPLRVEYVEGLGGEKVAVPQPDAAGRAVETVASTGFGEALLAVQAGRHITRDSWAQGSYVTAQAGYPQGIGVNANTAAATGLAEGTQVAFSPYLMRCLGDAAPRPTFAPWAPDQLDLFARDWRILPRSA